MNKIKIFALATVLASTLLSTSSFAFQGSQQDQNACRGDVMSLCMSAVGSFINPNVAAITACLKANMSKLSPACRTVMSK
jgi:hypothetical protein